MKKWILIGLCTPIIFNVGAQNVQPDKEAEAVIRYANSVIELTNNYYKHLNKAEKKLKNLMDYRDLLDYKDDVVLTFYCDEKVEINEATLKMSMEPIDSYSETDQVFIKNSVEQYGTGMEKLAKQCVEIDEQVKDKKYEQDEFNNLDSLILASDEIIEKLTNIHSDLVNKVMGKANAAEETIQENSPLGPLVKPMKEDLKLAKQILNKVSSWPDADKTAIKMESLRLRGGISKSVALKGLYKKELGKKNIERFVAFYDKLENGFVAQLNGVLENIENAKDQKVYDALEEDKNMLLEKYNSLVVLFNEFGLRSVR